MSRLAVFLLVLTVFERTILAQEDPVVSDEAKLEAHLFESYDSMRRPVKDHTKAVDVQVHMIVKYFTVEDLTDTITVHSWMVLVWTDEFLTWHPSSYSRIPHIRVDSSKIWQPELSLYNADITSQGSDARFYSWCQVGYDGQVACVPHVSHTALCAPDARRWPYDVQNCTLTFGSWMYIRQQINFTLTENPKPVTKGEDYQDNREWALDHLSAKQTSDYPILSFNFLLRRRSATHAAIVIIPATSLALLTCSCGLLKPGGLRLGVALTSLALQITYFLDINWYVPSHGDYPAYIIMFFRDSVLITTMMIFVSMAMMSVTKFTRPPPRLVSLVVTIVESGPAKFVTFGEFDPNNMSPILLEDGESNTHKELEREANLEWQKFASVFNNIFFLTITFTYAVLIFVYVLF